MARESAVRLRIEGRVQGVWFRGWTVAGARASGLRGWVRNRSDGSVEALLIGDAAAVAAMARRCGEGPEGARVDRVVRTPAADDGSAGFWQVASR